MGFERGRISRRRFVQMGFGSAATMLLGRSVFGMAAGKDAERPNILWISCEDTGQELGCYGDSYARTPFLDEFASEGVRFTNAFANIGVCAPAVVHNYRDVSDDDWNKLYAVQGCAACIREVLQRVSVCRRVLLHQQFKDRLSV